MTLVIATLIGALGGYGAFLAIRAMRPAELATALNRLERRPPSFPATAASPASTGVRGALAGRIAGGFPERRLRDLAVMDRDPVVHATTKLSMCLIGAGSIVLIAVFGPLVGVVLGPKTIAILLPVVVAVGYLAPDRQLLRTARRRRTDVVAALSAFLDLVNVLLAGGAGIETALQAAAEAGDGWTFDQLRNMLVRARTTRRSVWTCCAELGQRLGVDELVELSASVQLAGQQGARIAQSLSTRAVTLRSRVLASVEAQAQSASERMGLPTVLMFVGFLFLLGYPAAQIILGSS